MSVFAHASVSSLVVLEVFEGPNCLRQQVLVKLLLRHEYSADVVANGLEAVEAALRQR